MKSDRRWVIDLVMCALFVFVLFSILGGRFPILVRPAAQAECPVGCIPVPTATATATATPLACVTVTPAVTATATPQAVQWDVPADIPLHIQPSILQHNYWRITHVVYQAPDLAGGNHNVYVRIEDQNGQPVLGRFFCLYWPSGQNCNQKTELHDNYPAGYYADQPLYGGSWNPALGPGPYSVAVDGVGSEGVLPSDDLMGMGLPFNQHVNYFVTWRWVP